MGQELFISQTTLLRMASHLRAVVEVVPVVASANPVVVGSCVVGLVVGVGRLVEVLTSRGVLGGGSGVEAGGGLSVKGREHFVLRWLHCFDVTRSWPFRCECICSPHHTEAHIPPPLAHSLPLLLHHRPCTHAKRRWNVTLRLPNRTRGVQDTIS